MDVGVGHYDDPPPDQLADVAAFVAADRCRFANELAAWIEVDASGRIADAGYEGAGHVGSTSLRLLGRTLTVPGVGYPLLQAEPERHPDRVRFVQTAGGRTARRCPVPSADRPSCG
jgi:hypothetical protein